VSLANQVSFVMSLFTGSVIGAIGVLVAQYYGKGDTKNAKRFLAMAIRYTVGISLIFFLLALLIPEKIMSVFTQDQEMITIGAGYLRIVSFSYVFSGIAQCYLMMMKIQGRVKMSLWISAVTVIVDMSADFFLIYGVGKWQGFGANGSAYSTIAVELIAMAICIVESRQKDHIHPDAESFRFFSKDFEKDIWYVIPGMLASALSWGLSMTMHAFIIGHMGTDATAAYSVTGVAQALMQGLTHGLASGAGIMLGKMLGQNQFERAKAYGKRFFGVSFVNGLVNMGLIMIVGPLVYFFYKLEPQAKQYLVYMLLYHLLYMFAYAYNTVFTVGVLPAGGDSRYDAYSVIIATWLIAIPLSLLGCFVFHWPVMVVYMVMCADEIVKFPFLHLRFNTDIWLKNLTREEVS
ncbi:MAG: polysaccharide biosynthesis C-terminal domain-containing protein, partial [Lachnospiraceae bacterium]|nr:polysaccharide biosynthesis C-terminal domain-containing protein [Lachnospiraceae bacterium]